MMDDRFDELLRDAAGEYHRPPETPREEMWTRIAAERERRRQAKGIIPLRPWFRWGLGVAAVLALGIGIGRWTAPEAPGGGTPVAAIEPTDPAGGLAYQVAATQYLTRAETFLTEFRADVVAGGRGGRGGRGGGAPDPRFARQAGDLLSTTRLMLDSPAGDDARVRALLEELELVLVQIAQLGGPSNDRQEVDLITQGMEQRGVLTKLRTAIPAGPAVSQPQGVTE